MVNTYETLLYFNHESGEAEPLLAESWEVSDDGLQWTFHLREDVTFHSGAPMTAEAVKAAIERTVEIGEGSAYLWEPVAEIVVPEDDEYTVVFELDYPAALDVIASAAYAALIYEVPADDDPEAEPGEDTPFHGTSWGTGPYVVEEYNPNQEHELALFRFEKYWGGDGQPERAEFRVVGEEATAAQLLERGEVDSVQELSSELLESLADNDEVQIAEQVSFQNLLAFFNTAEPSPLADADLRRAVAHAIDYAALAEVTGHSYRVAEGMMPPGLLGSDTGIAPRAYDLEAAEEAMERAGYDLDSDIVELELIYTAGEEAQEVMAEELQAQLTAINIDLEVVALPQEQRLERGRGDVEARPDIHLGLWWTETGDGATWPTGLYHTEEEPYFNFAYYSNPELDALIDGLGEAAADPDAAQEAYAAIEEIIVEDVPTVSLGDAVYRRALSADVGGYRDNPLHANGWWLDHLDLAA